MFHRCACILIAENAMEEYTVERRDAAGLGHTAG